MQCSSSNVYQKYRQIAELSRLDASTMLLVSERSLADYECGNRSVPDDVVLRMADLYEAPMLKLEHLQKNIVFRSLFDETINSENEAYCVLRLQKEINDVVSIMPQITKKTLIKSSLGEEIIRELKEALNAILVCVVKGTKKLSARRKLTNS